VTPLAPAALFGIAAAAVVAVIVLVTWARLPAFVALAAASLSVGVAARMPLADIPRAFQQGMGDTLGFIAIVIGLGTIIGKLLAESGGALVIARALIALLGERRLDWAMMLSGFIVGLPVFFQVGLVLLVPIMFNLARQTGTPLLRLGIPLVAGLSAAHGLVPPHPGALAAVERLGADTGRTVLYAIVVGLPAAIAAGPLFGAMIGRRVHVEAGAIADQLTTAAPPGRTPSLFATLLTILLPVLLMLQAALTQALFGDGTIRRWSAFAGSPIVAMLIATLVSLYTFGRACGFDRVRLLRFAEDALSPLAGVLLVVGAGGGFGRVLDTAGIGGAIAHAMGGARLSPLVLGWAIAAVLRIAVGSATVACVTAASLMVPIAAATPAVNRDLLVVAIGAGSLIMSHVNDGGFWLVKEYLNMSVPQTVATWSIVETIIAVAALGLVLLLAVIVQ